MRAMLLRWVVLLVLLLLLGGGALSDATAKSRRDEKPQRPARDSVLVIPRVGQAPTIDRFLEQKVTSGATQGGRKSKKKAEPDTKAPPESSEPTAASDSATNPVDELIRMLQARLRLTGPDAGTTTAGTTTAATTTAASESAKVRPSAEPSVVPPAPVPDAQAPLRIIEPEPIPVPGPVFVPLPPPALERPGPVRKESVRAASTASDPGEGARVSNSSPRESRSGRAWTKDPVRAKSESRRRTADTLQTGSSPPTEPTSDRSGTVPAGGEPSERPRAGPAGGGLAVWLSIACAAIPTLWMGVGWLVGRRKRVRGGPMVEASANGEGRMARKRKRVDALDWEDERVASKTTSNGKGREDGPRPIAAAAAPIEAAPVAAPKSTRLRKMFLANLWRIRGSLMLAAVFMVAGAAVELLKPWPLKVILDHVILARPLPPNLSFLDRIRVAGPDLLVVAAAAIVVIALVGGMFSYFEVFITKAIGYRMVYALRREVFSHLQRLSLSFHNRARSGDLLTTFGKDTATLKDIFAEALLKFADHFLSVIGMLVILWMVNWRVALIAMASVPFLAFTLMHLYRQTKLSLKKQRKQEGRVTSRMNEVLAAVPLVQAFGRERHEEERYEAVSNETLRESIRMTRLEAAASRSSHIMTALGTAATVLFGGMEVMNGRMLPGDLVLVMAYLSHIYKPLRSLAKLSIEFSKASASAERIADVLEVEPEIQDRPDAIEVNDLRGEIIFAAVCFDYGDGKEVLKHISFEVRPGQTLALVGVSGAGKSTIASLILRLYEAQQGAILIDGMAIERMRRDSLRKHIGIVLQSSVLFGATIRENIAYGKPDATLDEIIAAAKTANADEFIRELEDGYDSVIGERGATLSAGQRQRIAIARAVIRNPRILILDEPMTGLDAENEAKVRQALERLMKGKTTIMITHDLASISDADQVLVLKDGGVAERGTHAELLARSPGYGHVFDLDSEPVLRQMAKA